MLQQLESVPMDQSKMDSLIWVASEDKIFSVESCYSILIKQTGIGMRLGLGR